jgi:hypothetical protein
VKKLLNIQKLLHQKSKHHGTKPMHPSSSRAFQRHQEQDLKHPGSVDLVTTKQNKLPSFIDKFIIGAVFRTVVMFKNCNFFTEQNNVKENIEISRIFSLSK